ncbi:MAG: hypothetical protein HYV09_22745 [Deltaproteobacteria bacterium]|nr:hypothetical protein [Deltaproteobacteria bacterium]
MAALALSCGYRPLRSGLAGAPKIRVVSAETQVAGAAQVPVAEELATGARAELARFGALGDEAEDRLRLEIVRLDEQSEGVAVVDGRPRARGVRLRLVARGAIAGPRGEWETPDVETTELVAAVTDPLAWDAARGAAARTVARRAGALVAREVLGIP